MRRVFDDLGLKFSASWEGPTLVAWGGSSIAELSKELNALIKKHEKNFKVKTALADGHRVVFQDNDDLLLKLSGQVVDKARGE